MRFLLLFAVFTLGCTSSPELSSTDSVEFVPDEYVLSERTELFTLLEVVMAESHICEPDDKLHYYQQTLKYTEGVGDLSFVLDNSVGNAEKVRRMREAKEKLLEWYSYMDEVGCFR